MEVDNIALCRCRLHGGNAGLNLQKNISSRASFSPKNEAKIFLGYYVYLDLFFYAGAAYHLLNGDVGADGRSEDGGENPSVGRERERKRLSSTRGESF